MAAIEPNCLVMRLLVCVFGWLTYTIQPACHAQNLTIAMEVILQICPYNDFCTADHRWNISNPDYIPCCLECSCASDCRAAGNCCPDAEPTLAIDDLQPCVTVLHHLNNNRTVGVPDIRSKSYRIITSCPELTNVTLETRDHCNNPSTLTDYVIVSGVDDGNIYGNVHCARCHGVADVLPWELYAYRCHSLLSTRSLFRTTAQRDAFIIRNCLLMAVPGRNTLPRIVECFNEEAMDGHVIQACNATSSWDAYDQWVEEQCLNQALEHKNLHLYQRTNILSEPLIFANPFCYMCNSPAHNSLPDTCERELLYNPIQPFVTSDQGLLLDIDQSTFGDVQERCNRSQLHEPVTDQCMYLHCPPGTLASYGQCVLPLPDIATTSINMAFSITFREPVTPPRFVLHASMLHKIERVINNRVAGNCQTCTSVLRTIDGSMTFMLLVEFLETNTCPIDKVIKELIGLRNEVFAYRVAMWGKGYDVEVQLIHDVEKYLKLGNRLSHLSGQITSPSPVTFNLTWNVCPYVVLSQFQLKEIGFNDTTIERMFTSSDVFPLIVPTPYVKNNSSETEVCIHEFKLLFNLVNGTTGGTVVSCADDWFSLNLQLALFLSIVHVLMIGVRGVNV